MLAGVAAAIVAVVVIAGLFGESSGKRRVLASSRPTTATSAVSTPPPPAPEGPPITVSAEQLYKAYKTNEISADEQYRGRVLIVTGEVKGIKKDFTDKPYLELKTSGPFEDVAAHVQPERAGSLRALSPGARVTVVCMGNNVIMGSPQLAECVLQ